MKNKSKTWWIVGSIAAVVLAVVAALVFFFVIPEGDPTALKDFPADKQQKAAQYIVEELNGHDVAKVYVIRGNNTTDPKEVAAQQEQDKTVQAAMPAAGCSYSLTSFDDRGEQGRKAVPGITKELRVWLLDLHVDEQCAAGPAQSRTLGLYFIPYMAHWTPVSFVA